MNFSVLSRKDALRRFNDAQKMKPKERNMEIQIMADLLGCAADDVIDYFSDDPDDDDCGEIEVKYEIPREYIISIFSDKQRTLKARVRKISGKKWQSDEFDELTEEINRIDDYIKMFMLKDVINITKG